MGQAPPDLTQPQLLRLYYYMRLTRSLEEQLVRLKRQGKIAGGIYRSLGQEADSVGSAFALDSTQGDLLCPLIRNLGSILVRGATPLEVLRQNLARATGPSRGREASFHFTDLDRGFIGHIAVLGDMVAVMAGCALAARIRGERRVCLVYAGDGQTSTGTFHESLNFAAVQRLPLVVLCESNGYAYSTPSSRGIAGRSLCDRALAYGIKGTRVDGNDVLAVYRATRAAVERTRGGAGVSFIELVTYRRLGHAEHDDQAYVPKDELATWETRDPLTLYADHLLAQGWGTREEIEATDRGIATEIQEALEQAESEPEVRGEQALGEVYRG